MILITSLGEFPFIILQSFFLSFISLKKKKKKTVQQDRLCCFCVALFLATGNHSQWIRNLEGRLLKVNLPQELGLNLN